jgi:transposase-like protein
MRDLKELCCANPECPHGGRRGEGNLTARKVYGKDRIQFLRCTTCGEEFSERKGTPLFGMKLAQQKAVSVLEHVQEGVGVRATGRLTKVDKDTVCRLLARAGRHAEKLHDELVASSPRDA